MFQGTANGAVASLAPRFAPSSWNCTAVTPRLSVASAMTVTMPEAVVPSPGRVIDTDGGVVSVAQIPAEQLPL